jgi:hypothetical protein
MMRIGALAIATLVVAVAVPAASAQTPAGDSVTGSGTAGETRAELFGFQIDAHSGPMGENPTGSAHISPEISQPFGGPITCLAVRANVATFNFEAQPGSTSVATFVATDSPAGDQVAYLGGGRAPTDCSPVANPPNQPLNGGDIVVTDATPPATYSQCRQAGWVAYGYASRAQCISAVHDFARQKCIFERVAHGITAFRAKYGFAPDQSHAMRHCVRLYTGF